MVRGWGGDAEHVSCGGGQVGALGSRRGCVSGSERITRTVLLVTMLSSPAFWDEVIELKVSFVEDGQDNLSVGITSGPSSSSEIPISPSCIVELGDCLCKLLVQIDPFLSTTPPLVITIGHQPEN